MPVFPDCQAGAFPAFTPQRATGNVIPISSANRRSSVPPANSDWKNLPLASVPALYLGAVTMPTGIPPIQNLVPHTLATTGERP